MQDLIYASGHFVLNFFVLFALSLVLALLLDALRGLCRYDRLAEALIRRITGRCAAKQT